MFLKKNGFRGIRIKEVNFRRFIPLCILVLVFWLGWTFVSTLSFLARAFEIPVSSALSLMFRDSGYFLRQLFSPESLLVGVAVGLLWYLRGRLAGNSRKKARQSGDEAEAPAPQDETIETKHYRFH